MFTDCALFFFPYFCENCDIRYSRCARMLLGEGLNQLPIIEVRPHEKHQCVRITKQPKIREYTKAGFGRIQTVGRKGFPTREAFEIYDRIVQHIRSIATIRP